MEPTRTTAKVLDPIDALQALRANGFGGRRIYGDQGYTTTLHYRRSWRGMSDVVLVYGEDDAEAYRADDSLDDQDPFEVACRPDLLEEAVGTVTQVVAEVLRWAVPGALSGYFTTSAPAADGFPRPDAPHASD